MNTSVKKIESPIQFWSMLGPLFIIGTLLAMNIQGASTQWLVPATAITGLFFCYLWRWIGCLAACVLLFAATAFQMYIDPSISFIWSSSLSMSFAVSFIVTTLFLDESQAVIDGVNGQSAQAKETLIQLQDLTSTQTKLESERQFLVSHVEKLKKELALKQEGLQSSEKLIAIVKEELYTYHSQHEKLLQELHEAHQRAVVLEQEMGRVKEDHQLIQIQGNEDILFGLKDDLIRKESDISALNDSISTLMAEKKSLELTLSSLQGEFEELSMKTANSNDSLDLQNSMFQIQIQELTKNKQLLLDQLSQAQSELETAQSNYKVSFSQEARMRHELDEIKGLYAQAQINHISNLNLITEIENLKSQLSNSEQHIEKISKDRDVLVQTNELHKLENKSILAQLSNLELETGKIVREKDSLFQKIELHRQENERSKTRSAQLEFEIETLAKEKEILIQKSELQKNECDRLKLKITNFEQSIEKYIIEREAIVQKNALQQANFEHFVTKISQLEQNIEKLGIEKGALTLQLESYDSESRQMKSQISELEQDIVKSLEEKNSLNADLNSQLQLNDQLHLKLINFEAELEKNSLEKDSLLKQSQQQSQESDQIKSKIVDLEQNLHQVIKEKANAEQQLNQQLSKVTSLEQELQKISDEKQSLPNQEEEDRKKYRELRRFEGLYGQMRDQFNEKSKILDSTRRELFVMQEKYASLQKDLEEKEIFGENEMEQSLYHILSRTESDLKNQLDELKVEISQLNGLIDALMQEQSH